MAQRAQSVLATKDVFQKGDFHWKQFNVETSSASSSTPKPLLIFTPIVPGSYPVILFCHGFFIHNSFYSEFLGHIALHGFILVAPQLFSIGVPMFGPEEVKCEGRVVDWLDNGLQPLLPESVEAKLEKLVLVGHSKGGKTAFAVALGYCKTKLKFSALIGIDPVAGVSKCKPCRSLPDILTGVPRSFNLNIPVAVIGTGLGPEKANSLFPPCAPNGVNHKEFFSECKPPSAYFVATDYGHMDMLDDETPGVIGTMMSKCMCKNGKKGPRDLMRRTVGGLVVAFLRAQLNEQWKDFDAILASPNLAPAKLDDRAQPVLATTDVFQKGDIHWKQFNVETSTASSSPPKPLLIFTPAVPGSYPFCNVFACVGPSQIKFAGKVVDWLVEGFQPLLLENVKAKLEKLVLSGHGGKTAFAVALDHAKQTSNFQHS
ncbi:Chlorophyllase-1 [Glycine max]|nr:Chlorophyllase-1 [Glycine max]